MKNLKLIFLFCILLSFTASTLFSQISLDWTRSYSSLSNHIQNSNDIAAGDDGCYYVLGANGRGYNGTDVALVKYNAAGDFRWARSYDGGNENNSDIGKSIATVKEGSHVFIYAACDISISGYGNQAGVMKYDTAGNLIWNKNIPVGYNAKVSKIAIDASGFIFTGGSTSYEGFLIKLNSAGDTLWIKKLPLSAGSTNCEVRDIVTDASGNSYCTGTFMHPVSYFDMFVCKYNSAGVLQWYKEYNYGYSEDIGNALTLSQGFLYATGRSDPSNNRDDIVIIKYNIATGDSIWVKRYNGTLNEYDEAKDISADNLGNVFVTGQTDGAAYSGDLITLKYNSSGTFQWFRKYAGPAFSEDVGKELSLDSAGNICIGGRIDGGYGAKFIGIKYNSNGDSLWTRLFDAGSIEDVNAMTLDKNNNFIMTGDCDFSDAATVKYNSSGQLQWMRKFYAAQLIEDQVNSLVTDKNGNVYAAGRTRVNQYGDQFTVIKYNSAGSLIWIKSYGVQLYDNYDAAKAMTIDSSGFIYVTGTSLSRFNNLTKDYLTFKLDTAGNQYWYATFHGSGNGHDIANAIAVDNSGNVYVTGESKGISSTPDYCTVKYNPAGAKLWERYYNGPGNGGDHPYDIAVDNSGNVYVTGQSSGGATGDDIATLKYNSLGIQQWVQRYNGSANGFDMASTIELDKGNNVYVCGTARYVSGGNDAVLIKYGNDASGTLRWMKNYNEDTSRVDAYLFMKLDPSGTKIYVSGQAVSWLDQRYSQLYAKYDSTGYRIWYYRGFFYGGSETVTSGMYLDEKENLYRIGTRIYPSGLKELLFTVTDSAAGYIYTDEFYSDTYGGFSPDIKDAIAVSSSGIVFIGFGSYDSTAGSLMSVIKYKDQIFQLDLTAFIQGFYNPSSNTMVHDTIKVFVRSFNAPYTIMDSAKAVLNSSGTGTLSFQNLYDQANYYLTVKHRNSIETWSDSLIMFTAGIANYNFSNSADKAFGNNQISVDASPVRFAIYNGDVNQDGLVDLTDVLQTYNGANAFVSGYAVSDLTGDNLTDLTDVLLAYNNSAAFVAVVKP